MKSKFFCRLRCTRRNQSSEVAASATPKTAKIKESGGSKNEGFSSSAIGIDENREDPMGAGSTKKEPESLGISTKAFVEKSEHVKPPKKKRVDELIDGVKATSIQEKDATAPEPAHTKESSKTSQRSKTHPIKEQILNSLAPCQKAAIDHVAAKAIIRHGKAMPDLEARVLKFGGYTKEDLMACLDYIRDNAPVIIHLKEKTLSLLIKDTHYRNQFETNTSGGAMSHASRKRREKNMFGSSYDDVKGSQRVKYGCLNITGDIAGERRASRPYGCLFLTLHPRVRHRTTFYYRDTASAFSNFSHSTLATNQYYAHVLNGFDDSDLKAALNVCKSDRVKEFASSSCSYDPFYKEVQIHGPVCLATDVEALSIPGRETTASQKLLKDVQAFQKKTNCTIHWQEDLSNPEN